MAEYRQIHTKIWKDEWFLDLSPEEKLLFVYLFSNESTSVAGIYRVAPRVVEFETGLSKKAITSALTKFEKAGKVLSQDGVMWVVNLRHYNSSTSPKIKQRIIRDLAEIPDCKTRRLYCEFYQEEYPIDTVSILYSESESEHEHEHEHDIPTVVPEKPADAPKKSTTCGEKKPGAGPKMMDVFLEVTGLPMPTDRATISYWWSQMNIVVGMAGNDNVVGERLIRDTVAQMKSGDRPLTISSPKSIINVARSIMAEGTPGRQVIR